MIAGQFRLLSTSLLDVFYPQSCHICKADLKLNEQHLCLSCLYDLPYISSSTTNQQSLNKIFWGRVEVNETYALMNYQRGNQTQELLQLIKYHNKQKLAHFLGEVLAEKISDDSIDCVIPIPLHPKKMQLRGYNQAAAIARGIADKLNKQCSDKWLKRKTHNPSQTAVTKFERWSNVRDIFEVHQPKKFIGKHILLVDDVLTTGATMEACIQKLLRIEDCKVSVATLAARI